MRRIGGGSVAENSATWRSVGRHAEDLVDRVDEAHLQHLVRFVEHDEPQRREVQRAALEVVHDAARACRR